MLFYSLEFLFFLPLVFILYWAVFQRHLRAQNALLLVASYVFYGWWDARFLLLIAASTAVDFFTGQRIAAAGSRRQARKWLAVSLAANLGMLGYFKYANFFISSWIDAWSALGITMHSSTLQIILPVGISFYTFQTLSYSIDIYRKRLEPTRDFIAFAAFVSFFPQLVAGPIERAKQLLPQIERPRRFTSDDATVGLRLIVWGLFKKVAVADSCALYVNDIFAHYTEHDGPTLFLGLVYFMFQLYGDFSGYSDMAIGSARLFGIRLMTNFKMPLLSRDIPEFWKRWHISLTTWFGEYVYTPLGGPFGGKYKSARNMFLVFLISGLWHGASWNFVIWGGIHGMLFLPAILWGRKRKWKRKQVGTPSFREIVGILQTFGVLTFTNILFRSPTLADASAYFTGLFSWPADGGAFIGQLGGVTWALVAVLMGAEALQVFYKLEPKRLGPWEPVLWAFNVLLFLSSPGFAAQNQFIYFDF